MRVLVTGGRHYDNTGWLNKMLDKVHENLGPIEVLIHGDAGGADSLADSWARRRGIAVEPYPANWDEFGRAAGPIRNQEMIDKGHPTLVVAFKGNKGTADMVAKARIAGIPVIYE